MLIFKLHESISIFKFWCGFFLKGWGVEGVKMQFLVQIKKIQWQ